MMMYRMTGAPSSGVTALSGSTVVVGRLHSRLHKSARAEPVSRVAGSRVRWLLVPSSRAAT